MSSVCVQLELFCHAAMLVHMRALPVLGHAVCDP